MMQVIRSNNNMKNIIQHPYLTFVFRVLLGLVFIFASVEKIISPADFAHDIRNYQIVYSSVTNLIAIFLPWLEFYCGLFLIIGLFTRTSAGILSVLLIFFIVFISSAILRGLDIDCGCFGTGNALNWVRIV